MATTEKHMSEEEARAQIQESLRGIAESQTEMLKLLFDLSDPEEAKYFEEGKKTILDSLSMEKPETSRNIVSSGGSRTRRRRNQRRRNTRKF